MISPFQPAPPELAKAFMESVQPIAPSLWNLMGRTATHIRNALGSLTSTAIGSVFAVPKEALYGMANIAAIPSVILNRTASMIDKTHHAVHTAISAD